MQLYLKLLRKIIDTGIIPEIWTIGIIVPEMWTIGIIMPIYKNKGDPGNPDSY
jgi:hypothetical protein